MHQETVQLGFGQWESAFLLDRILRGHHQEHLRQWVGISTDRHLPLAHCLQQRRLHLRRGTIDFVRQQDRVEDRPGLEFETSFL